MTTLVLMQKLEKKLNRLQNVLRVKEKEFDSVLKMGRTQLEDAVPVRLGQEFGAYASSVDRSLSRLRMTEGELRVINMGATAIGTGLNADLTYFHQIAPTLSQVTGTEFKQAEDLIDATQNIDCFAAVSSAVRNCAIAVSKFANDLRLMSSGPRTGLGEINLPAKQNGSSIMPGKVNPVIPEVVTQVAFRVVGYDVTIAMDKAPSRRQKLCHFPPAGRLISIISWDNLFGRNRKYTFSCRALGGTAARMARYSPATVCAVARKYAPPGGRGCLLRGKMNPPGSTCRADGDYFFSGSVRVKRVETGSLSAFRVPWCSSVMVAAMGRPRPKPVCSPREASAR